MTVRLSELAELVGGVLSGDGGIVITGADVLGCAGPGQITLADRPQLLERLAISHASAAVVPQELRPEGKAFIAVPNVREAFARIVSRLRPRRAAAFKGISPLALVSESALIEEGVTIYPHAFVGDHVVIGRNSTIHTGAVLQDGCRIGSGVTIFPKAVLYEDTIVGDRSIIHANAVLGAYGFGYELVDGEHVLSPQLGNVEIGDDVEIGAGTTIDRGTFGPTRIGAGTKIDNLVMIGHNCQIGRRNLLCGQVGIAGSCTTGDYVVMGGQVGLRDHVEIASGVMLGAKSGVTESLKQPGQYLGTPALPSRTAMQIIFANQRLPELRRQVAELERQLRSSQPKREAA